MNFINRVRAGAPQASPEVLTLAENLREGLRNANSALGSSVPTSLRVELEDVLREQDPQLFAEALLSLTRRAEIQGYAPFAATIYRSLAEAPGLPEQSRRLAGQRLGTLQGAGTFGERSEFFLRHFAEQASDPVLLLGMACGGAVYRTVRGMALAELGATTSLGPTTLRFLAGAAGFAAEAPAFALATRGARTALGRADTGESLGREILSSYIFLGAMKLAGGGADLLHRRWLSASQGASLTTRISAILFPQASMLAGVILGHRLEMGLGLRPQQDFDSLLAESLATLLHFHVSGRIFQELAGPGFRNWERRMDLQAQILAGRSRLRPLPMAPQASLAVIGSFMMAGGDPPDRQNSEMMEGAPAEVPASYRPVFRIRADESIPQVLRRLSELSEEGNSQTSWSVELPPGFAKQVSDWGYRWQEDTFQSYQHIIASLLRADEKLQIGAPLGAEDLLRLDRIQEKAQSDAAAFEANRSLLKNLMERASRRRDPNSLAQDFALSRVVHDLSHRPQFLQIVGLAAADLLQGLPLESFYHEQLKPRRGFMVGQTLLEGVSLSSAESPVLMNRVAKGLPLEDFGDLHLAQGSRAARGLGDILGNLLTNAWRYRRDDTAKVSVLPSLLPNGSFQISVRDEGMGIEAENLPKLGFHGFREGRRDLDRSHGLGLSSVVETLRGLGWGPLWVRSRAGEGAEFRFSIPRAHLELNGAALPSVEPVDLWGKGAKTESENNLDAGFSIPVSSLDLAITQVMREVPLTALALEPHPEDIPILQSYRLGSRRYRRLEILHRILAGNRMAEGFKVVENGPGFMVAMTQHLLQMGSDVTVKEPDQLSIRFHGRNLPKLFEGQAPGRLTYVLPESIGEPTPAPIVYWANPCIKDFSGFDARSLGEYFGRDVMPGGFLVLQTDHHYDSQQLYLNLEMDSQRWLRVYNQALPDYREGSNQFLPTSQDHSLQLQIFYRIP